MIWSFSSYFFSSNNRIPKVQRHTSKLQHLLVCPAISISDLSCNCRQLREVSGTHVAVSWSRSDA